MNEPHKLIADADLVLCWGLLSARRWLKGYDGPLVLVNHGSNDWSKRWIGALEPYASHFVGVSKQAAACFSQPAEVIHNGLDFSRLNIDPQHRPAIRKAMGLQPGHFAVGFVGRISGEKNPLAIAQACAQLGQHYRPVYFGPDTSGTLTKQIDAANKHRIYAQTGNIAEAYLALDCVVVASPEEGFSLVTIEALYAGCPLISTPVGILPEIEERHGQVAIPLPVDFTTEQLCAAIETARLAPFEGRGKAAAGEFTAERLAHEWTEFLKCACSATPAAAIIS